ncbi:hypothetical protein FA15DRAFT_68235 [Coprinopsis marcescibilis]|uniref:Uncharacterized protein n=1 Tax=Coprinopsis marcescibilis TaxID=230819 RepID=A0A5C3KMR8_COPMA|nr:hypothetical protein FA15DRAFT_68235 [Coprinopsis marcescibilis]
MSTQYGRWTTFPKSGRTSFLPDRSFPGPVCGCPNVRIYTWRDLGTELTREPRLRGSDFLALESGSRIASSVLFTVAVVSRWRRERRGQGLRRELQMQRHRSLRCDHPSCSPLLPT